MKNFQLLGQAFVGHLPVPASTDKAWRAQTWRQTHPASCHTDTETIYYRMPAEVTEHSVFNDLSAQWLGDVPDWVMQKTEWAKEVMGWSEVGRVMLVKLAQGGRIAPHVDQGAYANHYTRLHFCVRALDGVLFKCGREATFMREGQLWWFDHKVEHEVWNYSKMDRTHLIIDGARNDGHRFGQPVQG